MKLDAARAIGRDMGLETDAECINNMFLHAMCIFPYDVLGAELNELFEDAKLQGVRFSKVCGDAVLEDESEDELCYTCKKLEALKINEL